MKQSDFFAGLGIAIFLSLVLSQNANISNLLFAQYGGGGTPGGPTSGERPVMRPRCWDADAGITANPGIPTTPPNNNSLGNGDIKKVPGITIAYYGTHELQTMLSPGSSNFRERRVYPCGIQNSGGRRRLETFCSDFTFTRNGRNYSVEGANISFNLGRDSSGALFPTNSASKNSEPGSTPPPTPPPTPSPTDPTSGTNPTSSGAPSVYEHDEFFCDAGKKIRVHHYSGPGHEKLGPVQWPFGLFLNSQIPVSVNGGPPTPGISGQTNSVIPVPTGQSYSLFAGFVGM